MDIRDIVAANVERLAREHSVPGAYRHLARRLREHRVRAELKRLAWFARCCGVSLADLFNPLTVPARVPMAGWPVGVKALWESPLREKVGVTLEEAESLAAIEYQGHRLERLEDALLTLLKLRGVTGQRH